MNLIVNFISTKMIASIDGYGQANVGLNEKEILILKNKGKLERKILMLPNGISKFLPLKLTVSEKGWGGGGLPKNKPYEQKKEYKIQIPLRGMPNLYKRKNISLTSITGGVGYRAVYINFERAA